MTAPYLKSIPAAEIDTWYDVTNYASNTLTFDVSLLRISLIQIFDSNPSLPNNFTPTHVRFYYKTPSEVSLNRDWEGPFYPDSNFLLDVPVLLTGSIFKVEILTDKKPGSVGQYTFELNGIAESIQQYQIKGGFAQVVVDIFTLTGQALADVPVTIEIPMRSKTKGASYAASSVTLKTNSTGSVVFNLVENDGSFGSAPYTITSVHPVSSKKIHNAEKFFIPFGTSRVNVEELIFNFNQANQQ